MSLTVVLAVYALITAPLIALVIARVVKNKQADEIATKVEHKNQPVRGVGTIPLPTGEDSPVHKLMEAFKQAGIDAKFEEVPSTPEEAITAQGHKVMEELKVHMHWIKHLRDCATTNKRDMDAVMQSLQAITKALLEKNEPQSSGIKIESFVHSLEYVRDKFATTTTQKKAMESIISNVKNYESI